MLESLMLAQAQEMFYELMHAKRRASPASFGYNTLAQVAQSAALLYGEVTEKYSTPALVKHFDKEWAESSRAKSVLYKAEADYNQALHLKPMAGKEFGNYLGHLRRAAGLLAEKRREAKLAPTALQKQFKVNHMFLVSRKCSFLSDKTNCANQLRQHMNQQRCAVCYV
jgi:hypothetical protein